MTTRRFVIWIALLIGAGQLLSSQIPKGPGPRLPTATPAATMTPWSPPTPDPTRTPINFDLPRK